ncbi:pyrroline-5-carboxylate reductase [Rhizomicrobium palustre]|uniref:Pyrroline-5-carboxylate reductase n=1 Tax=Rhizomicrobium palustre TaxID=189966 RepID=A0A846MX72_9PROT|nr:pyrroline-5-carboxylate reductase [Rhizomicrobium palustre]NIK87741.1 pyrroline-5-carboxylate reductase [Rhizomicrobium palustre]
MTTPILIIGAGKMGTALIRGWVKAGIGPITVVEPNPSETLKAVPGLNLVAGLDAVPGDAFRACVVALKPHILRAEAGKLKAIAEKGALMLSIAAGTPLSLLKNHWGEKAGVVRAMPNTPGSIGQGVTAIYAGAEIGSEDRAFAETLLSSIGLTLWVETETLLDAAMAISGCGPAYVFALVEAMAKAGVAAGLTEEAAAKLARATVTGGGALLNADPRPPADLIRDVATPGGTTQAALNVLQAEDGLGPLFVAAIKAAIARAEELAKS